MPNTGSWWPHVRDGSLGILAGMSQRRSPRDERRRVFSQNFLTDGRAIERFLAVADLRPDDVVVEVGAGAGALTSRMGKAARKVFSYELDETLKKKLDAAVGEMPNVEVIYRDFLSSRPPKGPFKLVSNVPFGLTSAVLDWVVEARTLTSATLITQLEYAKKRSGAYGRWSKLTVSTWPFLEWSLRGRIARTSFRPVPKVDAGILVVERRSKPLLAGRDVRAWNDLVELGFSGVGGSLFASLSRRYPRSRVSAAFAQAGTAKDAIVAFVSPQEWLQISAVLIGSAPKDSGGAPRPPRSHTRPPRRRP